MQDNTMQLHDGRTLGYCEYGSPDGIPLLLFHGTPGSRVMTRLESAVWIKQFGMRVIVPERPGYGLSDPAPQRKIEDWAADVDELAYHLGLGRFHVAGGSGGGPYALACGIQLPTRVLSVTLICSGAPPEAMPASKDMTRGNQIVFFLARHLPWVLKGLFALQARAARKQHNPTNPAKQDKLYRKREKRWAKMLAGLPEWDRRMLESTNRRYLQAQMREVYRQGGDGTYRDLLLVSRPWGIDPGRVKVPVFLWHGTADRNVPVSAARAFSKLIPGCEAHFMPDAGHQLLASEDVCCRIMERMLSVVT